MNVKEQRYVCVLAECGNITAAAEKLFISQPALSIYINNLEHTLGVRLFDRSGKKFVPTQAGELYLSKAREMLRLDQEFEEELDELKHDRVGKLIIGIQLRRAPLLLPPVVARLKEAYPQVNIVIKEGVQSLIEKMLQKEECTIYVYNLMQKRSELTSHLILRDQMLAAFPAGHPILDKARIVPGQYYRHMDLADFIQEPLILPTKSQSLRTHLDRVFEKERLYPQHVMEIRNFETAIQLVAEGVGIGFNREQYAKNMMYSKPVEYCTFYDRNFCTTNLYASYPKDAQLPAYAKYAIELFVEEGRKLQG